ncbi:MAG: crossover junction endodeoxyribonuclease RuvC [Acidobacteria bacterium]|nr:crossover junction endodeoxyribonuclease RuvC [Acidobacteriota bacterium]
MRVIGIDPGSEATGYGVIEHRNNRLTALAWGVVRPRGAATFSAGLRQIHEGLRQVLAAYPPDFAAVGDVFFAANPRSALKLGQARGAILLGLELANVPVVSYTPLAVKKALVGYGRAEKEQVRGMVLLLLGLRGQELPLDASDALAVALCHAHTYPTRARMHDDPSRAGR